MMQLTQALTRAVQTRHRFTATIYQDRKRTWQQIGERVPRLAAGLRGRRRLPHRPEHEHVIGQPQRHRHTRLDHRADLTRGLQ